MRTVLYTPEELMATLCAREIRDEETVGVGVQSPVATAAAFLAQRLHAPHARYAAPGMGPQLLVGSKEVTALAQRGKMDLFFLSAAQIDGHANINLQYVGAPPHPKHRFPGAFAAPVYYYIMGRVVLFRAEHSPRVFVPKLDYVTATGQSPPSARRRGGPSKVITPIAVLAFNAGTGLLELESFHPGQSVESVREATGFDLPVPSTVHETEVPTALELATLRGPVHDAMSALLPTT